MEAELKTTKLREGLYLFTGDGCSSYLIVGEQKACVIDTMMGHIDLYKAARELTDKPIMLINTHGHPDHILGNYFFDKAYMNLVDLELSKQFTSDPEFVKKLKEMGREMPPFENISEGDVIDLGGRTLRIYNIPGHTMGGILLLCPEERILFTGDSINRHLWLQLEGCYSVKRYISELENILFLEKEADVLLHGHAEDFENIALLRTMMKGLQEIVDGKTDKDTDYVYFDGNAHARFHIYEVKKTTSGDAVSGIVYQPENVR